LYTAHMKLIGKCKIRNLFTEEDNEKS
jgi:hypothetical protein